MQFKKLCVVSHLVLMEKHKHFRKLFERLFNLATDTFVREIYSRTIVRWIMYLYEWMFCVLLETCLLLPVRHGPKSSQTLSVSTIMQCYITGIKLQNPVSPSIFWQKCQSKHQRNCKYRSQNTVLASLR